MNRCKSKEKEYLYCLCQIPGMGAVTIKKLWKQYGSFETIYNIEGNELSKKKLNADLEEYHNLEKRGIQFISILDDSYPKRLREIYGNPMGLYVKGKLPEEDKPAVAIIGARNC
ncbi:MAG: DNA-processing protein DprA, partial [Hungatella sp.]